MSDLDRAIQYYREAIGASPHGHAEQASLFLSLGFGLRDRYYRVDQPSGLSVSTVAFQNSFFFLPGLPVTRVSAGREAMQNLIVEQKWKEAAEISEEILELLPLVTSPTGSRLDLRHFLRDLTGFASQTASVDPRAGKSPFVALQALERGRGIIASVMMDARSEFSMLQS